MHYVRCGRLEKCEVWEKRRVHGGVKNSEQPAIFPWMFRQSEETHSQIQSGAHIPLEPRPPESSARGELDEPACAVVLSRSRPV